ncbi:hypothetical protein H5410_021717 [Solanum commersonii]|uniref:Uncharacterized protein n=1 Tax=Solanum commersonii TaxID=4109 RepID=A0A9J5ZG29_SOLCO|nr:hypothetical protein H5410_021717 [Solanum commersonii]
MAKFPHLEWLECCDTTRLLLSETFLPFLPSISVTGSESGEACPLLPLDFCCASSDQCQGLLALIPIDTITENYREIPGEDINNKVGVASVVDKMREGKLRWFGYVKRRYADALVRSYERLDIVELMRDKGRLKKYWEKVIRQNVTHLQLTKDMTLDRRTRLMENFLEIAIDNTKKDIKICGVLGAIIVRSLVFILLSGMILLRPSLNDEEHQVL